MEPITIWLLWTLFAGTQPRDVDAFLTRDQCEEYVQIMEARLDSAYAQTHREELKQLTLVGCQAVTVTLSSGL